MRFEMVSRQRSMEIAIEGYVLRENNSEGPSLSWSGAYWSRRNHPSYSPQHSHGNCHPQQMARTCFLDARAFLVDHQTIEKTLATSSFLGSSHWFVGVTFACADRRTSPLPKMASGMVRSR